MTAIRREKVVGYTRMVNRTMVDGIARVFTGAFAEKQLRSINISTEYPLTRTDYPLVLVDFDDRTNKNAGVGHTEIFDDENGILREWQHRLFEGTLTLTVMALTPLDRDVLYDALVEMLTFGRMSHLALQNNLFTKIYGDPAEPENSPQLIRVLSHIALNTDVIDGGGKSASLAPWGPEDVMVFEKTLSLELHGGYYNSIPEASPRGLEMVTHAFVYPKLMERISLPIWDDSTGFDTGDEGSRDANTVTITFGASADGAAEQHTTTP